MTEPDDRATTPAVLAAELGALIGQMKRRLRREASAGDFTQSQLAVLGRLDREGSATVSALARAEGVRPQSMGATVAALEAAGLLQGTPDPADGRQTILALTPACRDLIRAGRAARLDWLSHAIEARLSQAEQQQLADSVALLAKLFES
ncbi:MAG TPA: MarR family transcriptional regulator [Tardiphaga sp.]